MPWLTLGAAAGGRDPSHGGQHRPIQHHAPEKRFHDRSKLFPFGGLGVGYLTGILIAISVATALVSSFGENTKPILWLYFSEYDVEGGFTARLAGLPEIRHGEVWRPFTPM